MIINDLESSRRRLISKELCGYEGASSSLSPYSERKRALDDGTSSADLLPFVRSDNPQTQRVMPSIQPDDRTANKRVYQISSDSDHRCSEELPSDQFGRPSKVMVREENIPQVLHRKDTVASVLPPNNGRSYIPFEHLLAHADSVINIFGVSSIFAP